MLGKYVKDGLEEEKSNANNSFLLRKKKALTWVKILKILLTSLTSPVKKTILFQGDSFMLKEGQNRAPRDIFFKFME